MASKVDCSPAGSSQMCSMNDSGICSMDVDSSQSSQQSIPSTSVAGPSQLPTTPAHSSLHTPLLSGFTPSSVTSSPCDGPAKPGKPWASPAASQMVIPHSSIQPVNPTSHESGLTLTLQNVVSTVSLGCDLDLKQINFRTRNSEYNPQRFSGVVMRILEPRTTALIFQSGKLVCTGARNEQAAGLATRKFARIVQRLGFPVKYLDFKIQNIVATCDLRFPIRLENLNQVHGQFSCYEPELFPGLIYRMVKPRVVLLIFVNGKIVFTGAKTRQDLEESLETIYPILKSFRKQ